MFPVPRKAPPISTNGATRWGISSSVFIGIGASNKALDVEAAMDLLLIKNDAAITPKNREHRPKFCRDFIATFPIPNCISPIAKQIPRCFLAKIVKSSKDIYVPFNVTFWSFSQRVIACSTTPSANCLGVML